jgi:hypothetical protein
MFLLLEMIVATSQVAVSLGYILLHAHHSYRTVSLLNPTFRSDQTPGFPFLLSLCSVPSSSRVPAAATCAIYASVILRFLFSTALCFKEEHLLLDCSPIRQLRYQYSNVQDFQAYSPTGSYLSILSGRWVRGRRKVMKKPVRAIDMRRTATVLDFAVGGISRFFAY